MDPQMQALLDKYIKAQFADFKGSWANLHFELSEKVLNELLATLLAAQKKDYPLVRLVNATNLKGAVTLDVKLTV